VTLGNSGKDFNALAGDCESKSRRC